VGSYLLAKVQGLMCHATQFDATREAEESAQWSESPLFREETFLLGRSTVGMPEGVEIDLFRGLS